MPSPAQILANRENAQHSTNAFVRADEQEEFAQFKADYTAELCPQTRLEDTLAREIVHAAWRLERCAHMETSPPEAATEQELDRLQSSVDRARASARRSLHRSLAELRRVQTERVYRAIALPEAFHPDNPGQADCRRLDPPALFIQQVKAADAQLMKDVITAAEADFAKQTQSRFAAPVPVVPVNVPRNASCPCGSREKYKRCCGKAAPPVLGARAASGC